MDELPHHAPHLLWRGTRCLRNDSPTLRPCGPAASAGCSASTWPPASGKPILSCPSSPGWLPQHGLDRTWPSGRAGPYPRWSWGRDARCGRDSAHHPLKRLDAAGNRLLAMVLTLLTVGKGRTDKVEPLLTAMGCARDDPRRRTAVVLAAIVQVARFALRFDPLEIRLPGEPPSSSSSGCARPCACASSWSSMRRSGNACSASPPWNGSGPSMPMPTRPSRSRRRLPGNVQQPFQRVSAKAGTGPA